METLSTFYIVGAIVLLVAAIVLYPTLRGNSGR